jgi:multicomponent Na+:H+ antiporter subunit B
MSVIWILLESPDVALTEAAIGAGISSVLFFLVINRINRTIVEEPAGIETAQEREAKRPKIEKLNKLYIAVGVVLAVNIIGLLLVTLSHLGEFGSPYRAPANEVYRLYIEQGLADTGALNIVGAILYGYRSFDTLGEAFVLFAAIIAIIIFLKDPKPDKATATAPVTIITMDDDEGGEITDLGNLEEEGGAEDR